MNRWKSYKFQKEKSQRKDNLYTKEHSYSFGDMNQKTFDEEYDECFVMCYHLKSDYLAIFY